MVACRSLKRRGILRQLIRRTLVRFLLAVEIQVLRPRACVEEFDMKLPHATSCQTRHYTHTTSRHAALRHPSMQLVTSRNVASRHVRHCMSRYAVWRDATSRNATPCNFTPITPPQPTPLLSAHGVDFCGLHGSQKKKQRLFSRSAFTFLSIVY